MENRLIIDGAMMSQMNFSLQQNYVPLFRNLLLTNITDAEIKDATLRISFDPAFAKPYETVISSLMPNVTVEVSPVNIILSTDFLFSMTERTVGSISIEIFSAEGLLCSECKQIDILAYDQWTGASLMPELITAFITPNHPAVREIAALGGEYLQKWTNDPSYTAYQTQNPNNVKLQMAAIYAALQQKNIAYNLPPASFEGAQRVRLPSDVLQEKGGTCLDLAVLYCACLESVGLSPMLIFTDGHAFAGCHLEEETFPECVVYDFSALTKRTAVGIDELCLVECTDFTAGKNTDFDHAVKHANDTMEKHEEFQFAVDVSRCRGSGIRPMPSRVIENGTYKQADYGERTAKEITGAPSEIDMSLHLKTAEGREITKQTVWERKLLDMSLRNSLLNFRPTSANLQLMTADLGLLEDEIADGREFKVMPAPSDFTIELSDSKIYEIETKKDVISTIAESEFKSGRMRTFVSDDELERTMKKLHRAAKVSIEENGANTLYLALGFLRWFETDKSERPRYAPLVLIPVDIVKKVQDRSYSLRARDEDTQMNITLLEMLRQNFGIDITGLSPLPEDESGVNLPLVFNTVRKGVMSKSRWDIEEYAFLGQFSFSRFIMWNDIRNRSDDLKKNKVVASLISGKMEWTAKDINMSAHELDEKLSPSEMAIPTSTDSSQLAAIYSAAQGESFVLHGPPGTGKSQTITNMIANALYNGKTVLFIAEKMAALSVVQKRLAKIGLAPFCLELHSNKAQKRAVLSQLESTLNIGKIKEPEGYAECAEKLHALRKSLNSIMESIHRVRPCGMSVYDLIVHYEQNIKYKGLVTFTAEQVSAMGADSYEKWIDAVRKVATAGRECGSYAENPLIYYQNRNYSIELREAAGKALSEYIAAVGASKTDADRISAELGLAADSFDTYIAVCEAISAAAGAKHDLSALAADSAFDMKYGALSQLCDSGVNMNRAKAEIEGSYQSGILDYDADNAALRWRAAEQKWFLPKFFAQKKLIKELNLYAKTPVTKQNITAEYEKLSEYKRLKNTVSQASAELTSALAGLWLSEQSDFELIQSALADSKKLHDAAESLKLGGQQKAEVMQRLSQISGADKITENCGRLKAAVNVLKTDFAVDTEEMLAGENWCESSQNIAQGMLDNIGGLKDWSALLCTLDELKNLGAGNVAEAYMAGRVTNDSIEPAYICGVCCAAALFTVSSDSVLSDFGGAQLDDSIARYKDIISQFEELTVKELAAKLSAKLPTVGTSNAGSEIGILQKAIKSGGRMMPIRKLFDSIPNLLRRMCPCMLMSPISVAQYIDPAYPKFDLVIFDEASQLPTCEAVGAIARGENVIVVGDPKQLPPTSFFTTNSVDEENYEKEDLESVLDDCLALSMPQKHLLWHYRSRHESLIAYSNAKYYDNKLMTFPSPNDLVSEVSHVKVEGYYDKGSSKQNKAEARAVVDEIVRRLSDEKLRRDSIGVVTFSLVQQVLIDDMLADEYRKNPQLEAWANEMYEPILIKNLENVQGDERDVILFSVGYGPDKDGKVSMNFGPLNRDGGWRRLNVAISRSRKKMIVYSVITPDQIDLSRTRSDGVAGLKGFLEFAQKGKNTLSVKQDAMSAQEGIERVIADELSAAGYDAKCNIGCSDYKIDIAIVNPDNPDMYLLGIMCDGKNHLEAATARDRTVLQPSVLRGLGWNIMNVYVLDWLDNKEKVLQKIRAAIDTALENYRNKPAEEAVPDTAPKKQEISFEKEESVSALDRCQSYVPFEPYTIGAAEEFAKPENADKIKQAIEGVLKAEAPISRDSLYKKVLSCWTISRGGAAVKNAYDSAFSALGIYTTSGINNEFCWLSEEQAAGYEICRVTKDGCEKRGMDEIAPEEIACGVRLILTDQISMARGELIRETARLFGFARLGGVIESCADIGIHCALARGFVTVDENDKVTLKE